MAMKVIAVDIDDTLNDFSTTLAKTDFAYDASYGVSPERFAQYLAQLKRGEAEDGVLLTTEYSYFRYRIHERCHQLAQARPDAIRFMKWLREEGWRIVICTQRDLRLASGYTMRWLQENGIPYDDLFTALNKIVFCRLWGIDRLIDDVELNIVYGGQYGVEVYYPIMEKHATLPPHCARGFRSFDEVRAWIER